MEEVAINTTTEASLLDNLADIDLVGDLKSEWQGDEPGINFFLLLGALALFIIWALFAVYFFSRVAGALLSLFLKRLLPYLLGEGQKLRHFSIGSFSISVLAGKIMFKDIVYATDDAHVRVNDGYIIYSYWRAVPKKIKIDGDRGKSAYVNHNHHFELSK